MLAPLNNEVVFKKAFTNKTVFKTFVHDVVGIDIDVDKIETEKKFSPQVGYIDFAYDIFAESIDHRAIIEMQRVEYDYHFDRFLHYHHMAIAEQQRRAKDYSISQVVYTIVFLTAPYNIKTKCGIPIRDEVMISCVDPRNLRGQVRDIYGHQMIFLNPNHQDDTTPQGIRDWLRLLYASIHQKENIDLNLSNLGIKKVVELIEQDKLTSVELRKIKDAESIKRATKILETEIEETKAALEIEKQRADEEKQRAEEEKQRAEEEKQRAEEEKQRADKTIDKAIIALVQKGLSEDEAKRILGID